MKPAEKRAARSGIEPLPASAVDGPLAAIMSGMQVEAGRQVAFVGNMPPRAASYARPDPPLPHALQRALEQLGIGRLYSHQAEALRLARDGRDLVVVTATSSGKSLCYHLPVLERILENREARALYVYPINALINDQFNALARLNLELGREATSVERYS